jgi:FMN phosphatase YigB (HAD superfamily)
MTDFGFSAVFFDFGGTLFSYRNVGGSSGRLIFEAVARLGVAADAAKIGTAYRDATRDAYVALQDRPYYLHRELFEDTWRRFALGLGAAPDEAWVRGLIDAQRLAVTEGFALRDDARHTLEALRAAGLHVGVVSTSTTTTSTR